MMLAGVDFTSRPTTRKPLTVAIGERSPRGVTLRRLETHASCEGWAQWLRTQGPWLGVFDLPFGLPRALVLELGWPAQWLPLMRHFTSLSREEVRQRLAAFCAARPAGAKLAHRATDRQAKASSSMQWVNPPVALMLHAGMPYLLDAGLHLPGLCHGDPTRIALEGYPALAARAVSGARSYKSDTAAKQTTQRHEARTALVDGLRGLELSPEHRAALINDATGDLLDATLCLLQAGWASERADWGMPPNVDPLEGWIVCAPQRGR